MSDKNKPVQNPFETNQTNTTIFLLPPLRVDMENMVANGFWNAYLSDEDHDVAEEEGNVLHCLFRPNNEFFFEKMVEELDSMNILVDDYDYEEGFCVVVLRFPKQYDADFKLITESQYSKTSKAFQKLFPMEVDVVTGPNVRERRKSVYNLVFNKLPELRTQIEEYFGVVYDINDEYWPRFEDSPTVLSMNRILKAIKVT